uniref:RING-type E3 ubiquitin transferase n=1 Tax=Heliothis virescens TaxID=7102 RepID=A0A2A4JLW3_HELVI
MPIQAPQWTDYLNCPVCCREFGAPPRSPISLGCGHTLCRHCLKHLHRKQCPFDQAVIQVEPEELVVNTALLQLAGYTPPTQPYHPPSIQALPDTDKQAYDCIVKCMEHLAVYLKYCGNVNNSVAGSRLSRPMQRKLVMLLQCAITDEEGRGRAARAARSLGERTVTELILQHQNPQQLSANLWAAVRARGCQFLGPAMQEEVLKLVLLALEDGSALSRKVLVMFVVQRLEPHFPQASKTSIGHVVQLLYRASCFKVSKRECDSSLMQLKEEFRTYETLRREHDAQIVQIATEAGLRIAPDQWSALLYGDTAHKSHMQSIIDKLQTPQSFAQSVQELFIALQRTGDPAQLIVMSLHLDRLANIDASPDAKNPTWQQLSEVMTSLKEVVAGLVQYLQQQATGRDSNHNQKHAIPERCLDNSTNKLQTPQSFAQSVQELFIALQRTGDPAQLIVMSLHLDRLANIDASPDAKNPTWQQLSEVMTSLKEVVAGLVQYLQQQATGRDSNHNQKHAIPERCLDNSTSQVSPQTAASTPTHTKYKVSMCRDAATRSFCPRGASCTFAHSEEELERKGISLLLFRSQVSPQTAASTPTHTKYKVSMCRDAATRSFCPRGASCTFAHSEEELERFRMNGNYYGPMHGNQAMNPNPSGPMHGNPPGAPMLPNTPGPMPAQPAMQMPAPAMPPYPAYPPPHEGHAYTVPPGMTPVNLPDMPEHVNGHHGGPMYPSPRSIILSHEILIPATGERFFSRYRTRVPEVLPPYRTFVQNNIPVYTGQEPPPTPAEDLFSPVIPSELLPDYQPEYRMNANSYGPRPDTVWAPNPGEMFTFGDMMNSLPSPPGLGPEPYPARQSVILPMVRSRRSSPVEGLGPRTVGGPISVPGQAPNPEPYPAPAVVPSVTGNGPVPTQTGTGRLPIGADRLARERGPERLPRASSTYQLTGFDDQELEAGLQELERRIVTEFKNDD